MIEPKGKYLKDEVIQLFELYSTIDRYSGTQLFGLANLMSAYNPYFEYFGITPFKEEFRWYKEKTLLVQNVKLASMADFVEGQRFFKLVKGTDYADYLTNNTPWQDDNAFIVKRPSDSKLYFNIRVYNKLYGVWYKDRQLFVSEKNNPQETTFAALKSKIDDDIPMVRNEGAHGIIANAMEKAFIHYDSIPIRDMIYALINGGYKNS